MSRWKVLWIAPALLVLVGGSVAGYLYLQRQGYFDPPLVRFARAMSANDAPSVDFARAILADRTAAWKTPWFFDNVGDQFEPGEIPDAVAVSHAMAARRLEQMADFDWKEGGEPVADAIENMLALYDLPPPSDAERTAILAEAEQHGAKYSQIPIMIARYDRYFRKSGHLLALININSDSYEFVALPPETARCWKNVGLKSEGGRQDAHPVHVEAAIVQSADFIAGHAPELKSIAEAEKVTKLREPPPSACLPFRTIF